MTFEQRKARVNKAFNFYADTTGVDYVTGALNAAQVVEEDAHNARLLRNRTFPELKQLGYGN